MVMKLRSPFNLEGESEQGKNKPIYAICSSKSNTSSSVVVGLRILTQTPQGKSNVVVKSSLKTSLPTSGDHHNLGNSGRWSSPPVAVDEFCFLKQCHLCHKNLSLDKEVYMYRGDQGFCSVECRNRQIVIDEMKELELSTKKRLASSGYCTAAASGRRETRLLLEDLRRRNKTHHQNQNHWAIVS